MIDILIPLGAGSKWNNNELRYSLRSIEKHVEEPVNIVIVGDIPEWIANVTEIPIAQVYPEKVDDPRKELSILTKIVAGIQWKSGAVKGNFIVTNDDIFFNAPVRLSELPYYHNGPLEFVLDERLKKAATKFSTYNTTIRNTIKALQEKNYNTHNFDIHVPILYNSDYFMNILDKYDWNVQYGYGIKSIYSNTVLKNTAHTERISDLKIDEHLSVNNWMQAIDGRKFFSIGDNAIDSEFEKVMETLYPNKSRWEI